ncbi:response regulator [Pseudoduganella namucuonensis]|uniref:DNA binding domain-containing protein, excisionase family n=1 Tax=Pseudoduganella namucuonensis TaxID=1035707 RepID=A0A1I7M7V5_9BURK|nr:response regulator [Pseudoduganella namucuonensis]SFV18032.1 DNA binding domain-containing protein, excisionase family [Pseudoduganella namucuonensis]
MSMPDVLTTGEAARICGVNFRTVSRWIERGLLPAYKLPGRGDKRVLGEDLRRFMLENNIPDRSIPAALPRRILIADDEPAMARAIARVLHMAGFETAIASNGFEAGALLPTFKPGVMTLDLRMPGTDGMAVLRFMQTAELAVPTRILVVSADTEQRLQEALALGAYGVLRKPFSNEALLAAVQQLYAA